MNRQRFAAAWLLFAIASHAAQGQVLRIAFNNDPDILHPTLCRAFVGMAVPNTLGLGA